MSSNKILLTALLASMLALAGCTAVSSGDGQAVFTITDEAADMGAVSSVEITVDQVRVHSETEGWITVTSDSQTYDLLELKADARQALLAEASLPNGTYNQLRLDISNVVIVDNEGEHEAMLPSNELRIQGTMEVSENTTSSATFDFQADESLHVTGDGTYILAPVVHVETRSNAQVSLQNRADVSISGGSVDTSIEVGMDENGNVGVGIRIPASANISVTAGGNIDAEFGSGGGGANGSAGAGVQVN